MIVFFFALTVNAQVMWQIKDAQNTKWYYQFGDEFQEQDLKEEKWFYAMPWGNLIMHQDLAFTNNNVTINDGILHLTTNREVITTKLQDWQIDTNYLKKNKIHLIDQSFTSHVSAGLITSKQKFKNGYFEIRFKSTGQNGTWPAFWLYGGNPNEEIDFFELKGEKDQQIHIDIHCPKGCDDFRGGFLNLKRNWGGWLNTTSSLSKGWNIMSGEWGKDYVKLFLNGMPIAYFKGELKTEQYLIINNSLAVDNGPFNPGPDKTTIFPNSFDVDYVRVWGKEDTASTIKNNYKLFTQTSKTIDNTTDLYSSAPKDKLNFIYNKKELNPERGTITLLPILYNKFSLSILGKDLGKIQVDVFNTNNEKVAGFGLENIEYYILDLSNLPTAIYNIKITVLNQELTHEFPIINPNQKIGIE